MNNLDLNKNFIIFLIIAFVLSYIGLVGKNNYQLINSKEMLLDSLKKQNQFVKVKSNIDQNKFKEKYKNDPVKLIYDPNHMWASVLKDASKNIIVFIEYNPLSEKCEMTARVGGLFGLLDHLSLSNAPLDMNLKFYTIEDDYCNLIYGYQKL